MELLKYYNRIKRFDKRSGFFTLGIPSLTVMLSIIITGTFLIDKQLELKYLREQSVTSREQTLKEEHEEMIKMLNKVIPTQNLNNSIPIPQSD
ncbi:uncharacterized protein TA13930 [Theileria annulata]|uniref:Uncharacterized protein n=1 Tax=Theileria annulata TaxID=5874 RepID=Q4UES9_THEAN|nr:uncharacterized protein TA13930 [Theileria annulata]CAI74410.1 hypothetical protein TA13930 [Theileria annulata]|eukprot:XP_952142.1 hypothetical protein TA13930 [Theileria annulata]